MPRPPRVHVAGGFYHVTLRGNHRQPIFNCDADREVLDDLVGEVTGALNARVHAYCWMSNHLHAVVQVGEVDLGRVMQRIATRYARYFQKRMETTGHLFERRYHAVLVTTDAHLLATVRYVHLNPLRSGLVADPAAYRWSGHRAYLGFRGPSWLDTAFILAMFDSDAACARSAYARFTAAEAASGSDNIEGRSIHPPALPGRSVPWPVAVPAEESLDQLIARICRQEGVELNELRSRSRVRRLVRVRARIAEEACKARLGSLSELARRFDRHVSALSRALNPKCQSAKQRKNANPAPNTRRAGGRR